MTDDDFLDAIGERPEDLAPRVAYADWLEARGDARAEYLRLTARLVADLRRLAELRAELDADWVADVDLLQELFVPLSVPLPGGDAQELVARDVLVGVGDRAVPGQQLLTAEDRRGTETVALCAREECVVVAVLVGA